MLQHINLYRLLPEESKEASLKKLLFAYSVFVFFLVVMTIFSVWEKHKKGTELFSLQKQLTVAEQQLAALILQNPMLNPKDLEMSMQQLKQELDVKSKIVALLAQERGISADLKGLAAASVRGAWLTEFTISIKEMQVNLRGQALRPGAVQEYLSQLLNQPAFMNTPLELREITNPNTGSNPYKAIK
jgi:hypothetical protein